MIWISNRTRSHTLCQHMLVLPVAATILTSITFGCTWTLTGKILSFNTASQTINIVKKYLNSKMGFVFKYERNKKKRKKKQKFERNTWLTTKMVGIFNVNFWKIFARFVLHFHRGSYYCNRTITCLATRNLYQLNWKRALK